MRISELPSELLKAITLWGKEKILNSKSERKYIINNKTVSKISSVQ